MICHVETDTVFDHLIGQMVPAHMASTQSFAFPPGLEIARASMIVVG